MNRPAKVLKAECGVAENSYAGSNVDVDETIPRAQREVGHDGGDEAVLTGGLETPADVMSRVSTPKRCYRVPATKAKRGRC